MSLDKVLLVAGARPNFMKVAPIIECLDERGIKAVLVHTGRHDGTSDERRPLRSARPACHRPSPRRRSRLLRRSDGQADGALRAGARGRVPDVVIVSGDVNSSMARALVTAKLHIKVAHVEAGLRSRDWTMPEEVNRVVTDRISDYLFAPSADAVDNLRQEGYPEDRIHLVGNVMVDTLLKHVEAAKRRPTLANLGVEPGGYGLVTLHRPSNVDDPDRLKSLLGALSQVATMIPLLYSVHPRAREAVEAIGIHPQLRIIEPQGYLDFLAIEAGARLILTDSGGIQEETIVLGVPCLTFRETSERPITVTQGTNHLVGLDWDAIIRCSRTALSTETQASRPALWDGRAAQRVVTLIDRSRRFKGPRP